MDTLTPIERGIQIGMDIGQQVDPTAIVVAEKQLRGYSWSDPERRHPDDRPIGGEIHYVIQFITRLPLRTPYPQVAERMAEIYAQLQPAAMTPTIEDRILERHGVSRPPPLHHRGVDDVLIDATGVGAPVVELIRDKGVDCTAVILTSGENISREWRKLRLPKEQVISRLQVLLQQRCIHLPATEEARALSEELLNYEIRVSENAHLKMGVFSTGKHDDLATALGLACWKDESSSGTITHGYGPDVNAWRG